MSKSIANNALSRSSSEKTRAALIEAALELFGEKGFAATSTREIAAAAKANIGSIAYHFGGKDALRDACAVHIVDTIRSVAAPVLSDVAVPNHREGAEALLRVAVERVGTFMVAGSEAGAIVRFILHEMQHPTPALDIVYRGVFEPIHRRFCQVWAATTGQEPESDEAKITVFTMIGQLVYFRIGREAVVRRMGWNEIGEREAQMITSIALGNMMAVIAAHCEEKS